MGFDVKTADDAGFSLGEYALEAAEVGCRLRHECEAAARRNPSDAGCRSAVAGFFRGSDKPGMVSHPKPDHTWVEVNRDVCRKHLFIGVTVAGAAHMIYKIGKFIQFLLDENKELQRRKAMTAAKQE